MFMTRSPRSCTRLKTVHDTNYIHSFIWADDGFISLMKFMDDVVSGFIFFYVLMMVDDLIWFDLRLTWLLHWWTRVQSPLSLTIFPFHYIPFETFLPSSCCKQKGGEWESTSTCYVHVDVFIIGPRVIWFWNLSYLLSSFVLLHSDVKANLKPNHDVNDGFGMSCFEPSHFTKSKCDSGKIVWRCPLRGHTFFPHSRLFNIFTAVSVYSLGNTLRIGAAALDSGYRWCDIADFDSFGLPLEPNSSHLLFCTRMEIDGVDTCSYIRATFSASFVLRAYMLVITNINLRPHQK